MSSVEQFATVGKTFEEAPSPLREAIADRVGKHETLQHLIHSPEFVAGKFRYPASLLCVTDSRWLIALLQKDKRVVVSESPFDSTLLAELTIILLHGQLKIDFVSGADTRSAACQFNTVMQKVYRNALQDILRGLDGGKNVKGGQDWGKSRILMDLPLKFRNVSIIYGPQNSYLVAGVHWGEVYGSFHRQVAPAAAIVLSDRNLMIIAEEKPARWFQFRAESHYGEIITYFPLDRLAKFEIR